MENFDRNAVCQDVHGLTSTINYYKNNDAHKDFDKDVEFVRNTLRELLSGNDEKLIELLVYDAYQFMIESKGDATTTRSEGRYLDIRSAEEDENKYYLTCSHYLEGLYQGSFHASYPQLHLEKNFRFGFDRNEGCCLMIESTIGDDHYLDTVCIIDEKVTHFLYTPYVGIRFDEDNFESVITNYINKIGDYKIASLFPELINEPFFKKNTDNTRTNK